MNSNCVPAILEGTVDAAGACRERDIWRDEKQRDAMIEKDA
jgi:hypothetical protein